MKRYLPPVLLLLTLSGALAAQSEVPGVPVLVERIEWNIADRDRWRAGITREPALRKYFDIKEGEFFDSTGKLEQKVALTVKSLNLKNIYKEIDYEITYRDRDEFFDMGLPREYGGALLAHITVSVQDSFSLYLLPYYLYDSNLGSIWGGNFKYNNAFGSLTNLQVQGYLGDDNWKIGGVWENVFLGGLRGDVSLFSVQNKVKRVNDRDETVLHYTYSVLDLFLHLEFPLERGFSLSLEPGAYLPFHFRLRSYDPDYGRREFDNLEIITSGYARLGGHYTNLFWEEQFRRGVKGDLLFSAEGPGEDESLTLSLDGSVSLFYRTPLSFVGMGHQLKGFYLFNGLREGAADSIRGILDHLMYGEGGIFLNNNLDIRAFKIPPVLDVHVYPLLDLGYVYNSRTPFDPHDFRMTAGFGIVLFPLFLQSLQLNLEIGYDLDDRSKSELTMQSSLFF